MIDYVRVDKAPKELTKKEFAIYKPDFLEFIARAKGKNRSKNITSLTDLRNIFIEIGAEYNEAFSAYTHVNLTNFVGVPYKDDKELSAIISKIVGQQQPLINEVLIEKQIKKIPDNIERVYFVANDLTLSGVLNRHNIRMAKIEPKKDPKTTTKVEPKNNKKEPKTPIIKDS